MMKRAPRRTTARLCAPLAVAAALVAFAAAAPAGDPYGYGGSQITVIRPVPGGTHFDPYAIPPGCAGSGGQVSIYKRVGPGTIVELTPPPPRPIPGAPPCAEAYGDDAADGEGDGEAGN